MSEALGAMRESRVALDNGKECGDDYIGAWSASIFEGAGVEIESEGAGGASMSSASGSECDKNPHREAPWLQTHCEL